MNISDCIKTRTPIDIDLDPNRDEIYSGICLKQNEEIFILIEFDYDSGMYDGFLIIRNADIEKYRIWEEEDFEDLKADNSSDYLKKYNFDQVNNFEEALRLLQKIKLISLYVDEEEDEFYVGKIKEIDTDQVVLNLIDTDGSDLGEETFEIDEIDIIGFDSNYEASLS